MKQTLNLNLSTQIRMTPQLQHAIKLLQMSTLDLQQEIQENLENNPLLEEENQFQNESKEVTTEDSETNEGIIDLSIEHEHSSNDLKERADMEESHVTEKLEDHLSDELPLDATWEDTYQASQNLVKEKNEFGHISFIDDWIREFNNVIELIKEHEKKNGEVEELDKDAYAEGEEDDTD